MTVRRAARRTSASGSPRYSRKVERLSAVRGGLAAAAAAAELAITVGWVAVETETERRHLAEVTRVQRTRLEDLAAAELS